MTELTLLDKLFSEFGIISTLFIAIILGFLFYLPKFANRHFETIEKMQDKFSDNLDRITSKNDAISQRFISNLDKLERGQDKTLATLDKLDKTQDIINNKIR